MGSNLEEWKKGELFLIGTSYVSVYAGLASEENSKLNRFESKCEAKNIKEIS